MEPAQAKDLEERMEMAVPMDRFQMQMKARWCVPVRKLTTATQTCNAEFGQDHPGSGDELESDYEEEPNLHTYISKVEIDNFMGSED